MMSWLGRFHSFSGSQLSEICPQFGRATPEHAMDAGLVLWAKYHSDERCSARFSEDRGRLPWLPRSDM